MAPTPPAVAGSPCSPSTPTPRCCKYRIFLGACFVTRNSIIRLRLPLTYCVLAFPPAVGREGRGSLAKKGPAVYSQTVSSFPPLSQPGPEGTRPNGGLFARAAGAVARPTDRPTAWGALAPSSSFMGRWELAFYQANSPPLDPRPSPRANTSPLLSVRLRPFPSPKALLWLASSTSPGVCFPSPVSACPTKKNARMEGPFIPPTQKKLPAFCRLPFSFFGGESGLGGGQQQEWQKMRDQETHGKEGQGERGGGELLPSIFCPRTLPPNVHLLRACACCCCRPPPPSTFLF